jgi:hypothetical protein
VAYSKQDYDSYQYEKLIKEAEKLERKYVKIKRRNIPIGKINKAIKLQTFCWAC